jgi:hypothetical protein
MVAAKVELSNTFLHTSQALDRTGEEAIEAPFSRCKRLEKKID